jgi:hypothetical protein
MVNENFAGTDDAMLLRPKTVSPTTPIELKEKPAGDATVIGIA